MKEDPSTRFQALLAVADTLEWVSGAVISLAGHHALLLQSHESTLFFYKLLR